MPVPKGHRHFFCNFFSVGLYRLCLHQYLKRPRNFSQHSIDCFLKSLSVIQLFVGIVASPKINLFRYIFHPIPVLLLLSSTLTGIRCSNTYVSMSPARLSGSAAPHRSRIVVPGKTWRSHSLSAKRLSICPAHHKTLSLASESRNAHYDNFVSKLFA